MFQQTDKQTTPPRVAGYYGAVREFAVPNKRELFGELFGLFGELEREVNTGVCLKLLTARSHYEAHNVMGAPTG